MNFYLLHHGGNIIIEARAEGAGMLGDFSEQIAPGQMFLGNTFAELYKLGEGEHDINEKETA